MFRHRGKSRTNVHNLKLASLLSFVAGMVNVSGLLAVHKLTTNVTGHFAYFADEMSKKNFTEAWLNLLLIVAFFVGAFCSGFLVELTGRYQAMLMNVAPVGIEIILLTYVAFLNPTMLQLHGEAIACLLLFAMGIQNALVTSISNAIVRTTHLTGLFTDLGIELAQLFFYKQNDQQQKLRSSIRLRFTVIFFFFFGGIVGGVGYFIWGIKVLLVAVATLIVALIFDSARFTFIRLKRKYVG